MQFGHFLSHRSSQITGVTKVEHLLLKAATTAATDEGTFTAVISAAAMDREGDVVEPAAMVAAFAKWAALGKLMPLAWNHTDEVVGHIDPSTVQAVDGEVVAAGWVDQSTDRGEETWRLVKSGTLSFSFGFLIPDGGAAKLAGGRMRIKEVDVYEVSAIPVGPAHNNTRVLSWKSAAESIFAEHELEAAVNGDLKAVWTAAYINDLPDSAFLLVEDGGEKDDAGKTTPRSLRHFPVRDASGGVDMPHLRNALSRIPQSDLPQAVKDRVSAMAQRMLDSNKSAVEDPGGEDPVPDKPAEGEDPAGGKPKAQDPLRKRAEELELEFLSSGVERKSPPVKARPKPDLLPLAELKARMREEMLASLSGGIE